MAPNAPSLFPHKSKSTKAGLAFPVHAIWKKMKKGNYAKQVRPGAGVYVTAVIEYLVAEVLELSAIAARDNKKQRITPRHIFLAIKNDDELAQLCKDVNISEGGVLPFIHSVLLPKQTLIRRQIADEQNNQ